MKSDIRDREPEMGTAELLLRASYASNDVLQNYSRENCHRYVYSTSLQISSSNMSSLNVFARSVAHLFSHLALPRRSPISISQIYLRTLLGVKCVCMFI